MSVVRSVHLEHWSGTTDARNKLGELIRVLIHSSLRLDDIYDIRFLVDEASQLSGWDGVLECTSAIPWIPDGNSVWELGAGANTRQKIKDDFNKRLDADLPTGWDRSDTTYVAGSLRKYDDLKTLEAELNDNSPWKEVRIVDATVFEEWINRFVGAQVWLQDRGVGLPSNVKSLYKAWAEWANNTQPPITPELMLINREKEARDLRAKLDNPSIVIKVKADSANEVIAFVYTAILDGQEERTENFLAKTIVVKKSEDCSVLEDMEPQLIVLADQATGRASSLSRAGHTVICAIGNTSLAQDVDVQLKRPLRREFQSTLEGMGLSKNQAAVEAKACGASSAIWRVWNQIQHGDPGGNLPVWASEQHRDTVVPVVLLGGWSDAFEGDKNALEQMTEMSFTEFRKKIRPYLSQDDPFLSRVDDAWVVTASATSFALITNFIDYSHLEEFESITKEVFSEIDPIVDVPPDERPYASTNVGELSHSRWLRDGLAETLLKISVLGEKLDDHGVIPGGIPASEFVDRIVKESLSLSSDSRLLISLRDQLPVLAEAAPLPFMEALERLLQGHPDNVKMIFEEGEHIFGHTFHPNILWALETIAWEPTYLARVSLILADLATLDPGGNLNNRPINSLREIFLAWNPGTAASLDVKLDVLKLILERNASVGWELLSELLPMHHGVSHPTHEPIWKDFSRSQMEILTNRQVWLNYRSFVDCAIGNAGESIERWLTLIDVYPNASEEERQLIEEGLASLAKMDLEDGESSSLWSKLRQLIGHHRAFPAANWSLDEQNLARLENCQIAFEPQDVLLKFGWLFEDQMPEIANLTEDFESNSERIDALRLEAIGEIVELRGAEGLYDLIDRVNFPGLISKSAVGYFNEVEALIEILCECLGKNRAHEIFASQLSALALERFSDVWTERLFKVLEKSQLSPQLMVVPFIDFPKTMENYRLIESLGVQISEAYWSVVSPWGAETDGETISYTVEKFLEFNRAIEVVSLVGPRKSQLSCEYGFRVLEGVLKEVSDAKDSRRLSSESYWIEKIFEWLRSKDDKDIERLARLEYPFLPVLTRSSDIKDLTLHELLSTTPEFFVEIISNVYKPSNRDADVESEPTKEAVNKAELGWELLHSWKKTPGAASDGSLDQEYLEHWIFKARRLAIENDREEITDQYIGKVIYHAPSDPKDKLWPHEGVRDLIEKLAADHIERGIKTEQFNSRGVTSRGVYEGGEQERELAAVWKERGQAHSAKWPRTSSLCYSIAEMWMREAARNDDDAEKSRLKY